MQLLVPTDLAPMEARLAEALPSGPEWQFEPKWDGFRCLAFRDGKDVELRAKSGKSLTRFFPDVVAMFAALPGRRFVLDGELLISTDDGFSFDALQMRLHPAKSRVNKLAREQPATFVAFDCLLSERGKSLLDQPFEKRHAALEAFFARTGESAALTLSPHTSDRKKAQRWLDHPDERRLDGVIAKRLDIPYEPGERAMIKVKRLRTADCVVGGFRYASNSRLVGSLLLGLYDADGLLHHVGFTSSIAAADKPALTQHLEKLIKPPGFTGNSPGGPSRWSTECSADGSRCSPSSSSRSATITSPTTAFAMAPS
jgi:ATP-dependent DNA ligase